MTLEDIVNADSKFDPTTPCGTWDNVAREFENTTDKLIYNLDFMTVRDAIRYNGINASPTPISGDMIAHYKENAKIAALIADQTEAEATR